MAYKPSMVIWYQILWQILSRKAPGFGWATLGWANYNIDTFVPNV